MTTRLGLAPMIGGEQYDVDRAAIESNRSFDEASGMLNRDLERRGINPNSGRFAGAKMKLALRRAASEAGAKTRAYNTAQDRSFNRLMQLIAMGRNGMLGRQTALGPQMLPGHTVGRPTDGGGGGDYNARVQQRVLELGGQAMGGGAAPLAGGNPRVIPLGSNPRAIGMAPLAPPRQRVGYGFNVPVTPPAVEGTEGGVAAMRAGGGVLIPQQPPNGAFTGNWTPADKGFFDDGFDENLTEGV